MSVLWNGAETAVDCMTHPNAHLMRSFFHLRANTLN